jgi:membrane-bound transcription factor site-1 protease
MWPYCTQPLYHSAKDLIINVTILNGMGVTGVIAEEPQWLAGKNGQHIEVYFCYLSISLLNL